MTIPRDALELPGNTVFEPDKVFLPGERWFYAKLYSDARLLTEIASRHLPNALIYLFELPIRSDTTTGSEVLWYFVRYSDPEHHLRLRIHLAHESDVPSALRALRTWGEKLRDANLISRVELGTYEQETHRYGGPGHVEHAERVFAADSADCIELLAGPYRGNTVAEMALRIATLWAATADPDVQHAALSGKLLAQKRAATYEEKTAAVRLHRDRAVPSGGTQVEREIAAFYEGMRGSGISAGRRVYIASSLAHMHANRAGATAAIERKAVDAATSIARSLGH